MKRLEEPIAQTRLFQEASTVGQAPTYDEGRDILDRYYTPPFFVDVLLHSLGITHLEGLDILEPFAGRERAIAGRLEDYGHTVKTADVDQGASVDWHGCSFSRDWKGEVGDLDAVITNPPFEVRQGDQTHRASDAVKIFVPRVRRFAAFLMRLSFLEPCQDREALLASDPPDLTLVLPRHSFRKDGGSDMMTCAWFVWFAQASTKPTIKVLNRQQVEAFDLKYRLERLG
jgi:hypothetical protein